VSDRSMFYDTIAADLDRIMNRYEIDKRRRIIADVLLPGPLDGLHVLDAGCGSGLFTADLVARGAEVTSIDIGRGLVQEARKKAPAASLAQSSLQAIGFASGTFDAVLCTEVIEHTPDPRLSLGELFRVLKPGGTLVVTVPNRLWHVSVTIADWLNIRPYKGFENWVWRRDLLAWIHEENGVVEQCVGFNLLPLFYRPFHGLLDFADRHLRWLQPAMVNIGVRARKMA
jgi:2-polyprenyl-3-methyl-5-hydroxy-6-metoxy-1,4-benzoquinol methylase